MAPGARRSGAALEEGAGVKRILLGSSAAVAAGAVAVDAAAAEGVALRIGGSYKGAAAVVVSEDYSASSGVAGGDVRGYAFSQDVEVYFQGETVLDNGLAVGARVELEGQTADDDDQIDDVYAYVSGSFGELRFGDTDGAYAQLCYLVPSASELFGADSPDFSFSNAGIAGYGGTNGTCYGLDDNSTKLVYFSPALAGFQFAASFTPDNSEDTRNFVDGAGTRSSNDDGQNSDNLSLAAGFAHDAGVVAVNVGGGAALSFDKEANPNDTDEARSYNAYAQAAFAGFAVGVAFELRQNFGEDGSDRWVYGAGATYNRESWTVGVGWTHGGYEGAFGENGVGPFNAGHDIVALTAAFEVDAGVTIDAVLQYSDYRSNDVAGPDYRGLAAAIGTLIAF
jgi:outer membrane protein OmpU